MNSLDQYTLEIEMQRQRHSFIVSLVFGVSAIVFALGIALSIPSMLR